MVTIPTIPSTVTGLIIFIIGLIILWIIISIPVYFGGKAVTHGKATFGEAMRATLLGGLAYFIVYFVVGFFLGSVLGIAGATTFAFILAILAWLAVYKGSFETGWLGAIGIVIVSWIVLIVLSYITVHIFGVQFPDFFPF